MPATQPTAPVLPDAKPVLRWAGGKRRMLPQILPMVPREFGRYYEPFVGGGAVLLAMGLPGERVAINDFNWQLTALYTAVRDDVDGFIARMRTEPVSKERYLEWRRETPSAGDALADVGARFLYLNRLCFNGLYRENSKGEFNVPWGKLANPTVVDEPALRALSKALQGAFITTGSYDSAVEGRSGAPAAKAGDFVYFDPPYLPASVTASFSKYTADDFTIADHRRLAATIADLTARGVKVMLSNADTPLVRELYRTEQTGLTLHDASAMRSISAVGATRGKAAEVIGTNYELGT